MNQTEGKRKQDYSDSGFDVFLRRNKPSPPQKLEDQTSYELPRLGKTQVASGVYKSNTLELDWEKGEVRGGDGARFLTRMGNLEGVGIHGFRLTDKSGNLRFEMSTNKIFMGLSKPEVVVSTERTGDFTSIQDAIDYIETLGSGRVILSEGVHTISSTLTITQSNVEIVGFDKENTDIKQASGANLTKLIDVQASDVLLENFSVDGNKAGNTTPCNLINFTTSGKQQLIIQNINCVNAPGDSTSAAIWLESNVVTVQDTLLKDCNGWSIYAPDSDYSTYIHNVSDDCGYGFAPGQWTSTIGCTALDTTTGEGYLLSGDLTTVSACHAINCGTYGFNITGGDVVVTGCILQDNNSGAMYIGNLLGYTVDVTGNNFWGGKGNEILIDSGLACTITGNVFWGADTAATDTIKIDGGYDNVISGNQFRNSTVATDNTYSQLLLTGTSTRNVITGNRFEADGLNDYKYCIREASSNDDYNLINANIATGADTAQISTQGVNTVSTDNITS